MKFNIPKDWTMEKAKQEQGQSIEAGAPKLTREQWTAEVRRLLVEKYDLRWDTAEIAAYAESIAEDQWQDGEPWDNPDGAIQEEFQAGM